MAAMKAHSVFLLVVVWLCRKSNAIAFEELTEKEYTEAFEKAKEATHFSNMAQMTSRSGSISESARLAASGLSE